MSVEYSASTTFISQAGCSMDRIDWNTRNRQSSRLLLQIPLWSAVFVILGGTEAFDGGGGHKIHKPPGVQENPVTGHKHQQLYSA